MTRVAWAMAAAAGVTLVSGVGCYSRPQYAPYGYPTYPSAPASAYPAAPGGSFVMPPGSTMPGTLGPSMSTPGSMSGPTLAPPINGGNAPPATYAPGSGTPAGPTVPDDGYRDPSVEDYDSGNSFGTPPGENFQPPATNNGTPFMEGTAAPRRFELEQAARPMGVENRDYFAGLDRFQNDGRRPAAPPSTAGPSGVSPVAFEERARPQADFGFDPVTAPEPTGSADGGFGYEARGYAWLRGVIDFDPQRRNWHIIYGLPPDPADRYGGSLTLADDGRMKEFEDNDVVRVEGRIDPSAGTDVLGKPVYRVTRAELIGRFE